MENRTRFNRRITQDAEKQLNSFKKTCNEIETELDASGDTSEAAQELRASLRHYDTAVKRAADAVREYRRDMLATLGLNADNYIP